MFRTFFRALLGVTVFSLALLSATRPGVAVLLEEAEPEVTRPAYDAEGHLLLPDRYQEWVLVGSSLGLSYTEGAPSHEMFHSTLMEPTAYRHFAETGQFADGTMMVLVLQGTGEGVLPGRRGRFASDVHGVEMAVKDQTRFEEGWAYYGFGGMSGIRKSAEAFPKDSCYSCHAEHAARDNVFTQFYPMLTQSAPVQTADLSTEENRQPSQAAVATDSRLTGEVAPQQIQVAIAGLDPIMLVDGREELGKPEIVEDYKGFRYQFASEPNRARFAESPERFAIQTESCPVVPGAALDPEIFLVHDHRIYAFASEGCLERFVANPAAFLPKEL